MERLPNSVLTDEIRFAWVAIFKARAFKPGDEEKFSAVILIPKSDKKGFAKVNAAYQAALEAAKEPLKIKDLKKLPPKFWEPIRDGDEEREQEYFEGHWFINCTANRKPGIVDKYLEEITDPDEVYSGCFGRVDLLFKHFEVKGSKGIACYLNNVQMGRKGERLSGGGQSAKVAFDDGYQFDEDEENSGVDPDAWMYE